MFGLKLNILRYFKPTAKLNVLITTIVHYGCMIHCIKEHVAEFVICTGPSMEPTLLENDVIIAEHISSNFDYGDIVIAKNKRNPREYICKRITALPGDKVKSLSGQMDYVPTGHVWLEGDNQENSYDSREFGPLPQGLIKGRIICKIWPPRDISMLTIKSHT